MNYPLHKTNKQGTLLRATNAYYSDEYAQRMCELYLSDEILRNEKGKYQKFYRLHAQQNHVGDMAFAYDILCPNCGKHLKQVGRQLTTNELGLYNCPVCNKN